MPSMFQAAQTRALAVRDKVFGETFLVSPRTNPANERSALDPVRVPAEFTAQFFDERSMLASESPGHANSNLGKTVSGRARIVVAATTLRIAVRRPDRITRTSTGETFEVDNVVPDGLGSLTLHLTSRGGA